MYIHTNTLDNLNLKLAFSSPRAKTREYKYPEFNVLNMVLKMPLFLNVFTDNFHAFCLRLFWGGFFWREEDKKAVLRKL